MGNFGGIAFWALMSLQGIFNTEVTKQSSIWAAAGWVQLTAFLTVWFSIFLPGVGRIWGMFSIDRKYMLLGGVMGCVHHLDRDKKHGRSGTG